MSACGSGTDPAEDALPVADDVAVEAAAEEPVVDETPEVEAEPAADASTEESVAAPPTLPSPSGGDETASDNGDAVTDPAPTESSTTPAETSTTLAGTTPTSEATTTQPPATAAPTTAAPTTAAPTTQPPAANNFPDVPIVNVADRQTVNMASRLGGGDRPILLWFWTPF